MVEPTPLSFEAASRILARLGDVEHPIILVGGQALNFWASYYQDRVIALSEGGPYTSKDIDFFGSQEAVQECAARLGGKATLATMDDPGTPNTGIVTFIDDDGVTRQIDFLDWIAGVRTPCFDDVPASIHDDRGAVVATIRVMDPMSCLRSRAYNVAFLPGYDNVHARDQLRAAILCAKEFGRDLRAADTSQALEYNEHLFELAADKAGQHVFVRHAIDVLAAVVDDPGLPAAFYSKRLPQALRAVERAREKAIAAKERTEVERQKRDGA